MPQQFVEQATDYDYQQTYNYTYGLLDAGFPAFPTAQATSSAQAIVTAAIAKTTMTARATSVTQSPVPGVGLTARALAQTSLSTTTTSAAQSILRQRATSASRTTITDAELIQSAVEWRLVVDGDEIDELYDVAPVVDTANPFGDFAVLKMDDAGGELFGRFRRGTRVEVDISTNFGISYETRFTGFVVERRELEQSGADKLEVEAYSFDQFLRKNTVTNDQSGKTIAAALEDIVTTDTPVSFVPGNVTVGNPQTVTESLRGRKVEQVLQGLAFASTGEEFGVNDNLEFFFRPPETRHIERGIDNTQWFNFDIPELGKDAINEVELFFDDGNESVVVDRSKAKLDVQNELGLPQPATERKELNRDDIDTLSGAEQAAKQFLRFRNTVLTGTITTFGLFDAEPGDTIDVTVDPRGIDGEFRIAEVEYRWGRDETVVTIVEKRSQDQSTDILRVSEKVDRIEQRGADRDGVQNRITSTSAGAVIAVSADVAGTQADARIVNDGRRAVRDGFAGISTPVIDTIAVGSDGTGLSRSNTAVRSETARASVTETLPDSSTVRYEASLTQTDVQEVGLLTASGTLIARATLDTPRDVAGPVTVTLEVRNDTSTSLGVLTNDGQTAVRDILAANNPTLPTEYAYGTDDTPTAETDTSLGNEIVSVSIERTPIQTPDTTADLRELTEIPSTEPFEITNGTLQLLQSGFVFEGEDTEAPFVAQDGDTDYSDGIAEGFQGSFNEAGQRLEYTFVPEYDIETWQLVYRQQTLLEDSGDTNARLPEIDFFVDDIRVEGFVDGFKALPNPPEWDTTPVQSETLAAGEPVEIRIEIQSADVDFSSEPEADYGDFFVDVVAVVDDRYPVTLDNTVNTADGFLDGPELFPDVETVAFSEVGTRRDFQTGTVDLTINDTSGKQFVAVSRDNTTDRTDNSQTSNFDLGSQATSAAVTVGLGRFETGARNQTPRLGYLGQTLDGYRLIADIEQPTTDNIGQTNTRAIVEAGTITGATIREAGLQNGSTQLTRHIIADIPIQSDQRLTSSETTRFDGTE